MELGIAFYRLIVHQGSFQLPCRCCLRKKYFEKVRILIPYPHANRTMLIPNFQNRTLVYHTCLIGVATFIFGFDFVQPFIL